MSEVGVKYSKWISIAALLLLFFSTLPWYQYSFDVDATAYITIARQVANGEWLRSINGLWSPLNCWIAALFINYSKNPFLVFKLINIGISCGIIYQTAALQKKIIQNTTLQTIILFSLPIILLAYTHQQIAGDFLQLLFLLIYLNIITATNYFQTPRLQFWCSLVMALAYLAKSYSLPFFLVFHLSVHLLYYWWNRPLIPLKQILKNVLAAYFIFFLLISGWIYCLYLKYHILTFSTAGTLNYNWYLGNTAVSIKQMGLLAPPPYADSFNYWEDPYPYYQKFYGPLSSLNNFLKAIKLALHNIKESLLLFSELSFVLLAIFAYWFIRIIKTNRKQIFFLHAILLLACIVLTTGYLLIHIETRYIWFTGIAGLILGCRLLEEKILPAIRNFITRFLILFIFFGSFLFSSINSLQDLRNNGKDMIQIKSFFSANNIKGKFTNNNSGTSDNAWCTKLAFLTNSQYYLVTKPNYSSQELLAAFNEHNINFYLYFYRSDIDKENFLSGIVARSAKSIITIPGKDILVLQFQ
ncbi:MAG: hypothetical protein HYX40_12055 [Sphingobacteriales bacterium]|nr:hypothetical protein [Sphingobacteriales bacterium]